MKLLTKSTLIFLGVTLLLFSIGGWFLTQNLKSTIRAEADADLISESQLIVSLLHEAPEVVNLDHPAVEIEVLQSAPTSLPKYTLTDTTLPGKSGVSEAFRVITLYDRLGTRTHRIRIYHPLLADQELLGNIYFSLLLISLAVIALITLTIFVISRRLWVPFYSSLAKVESFDVQHQQIPEFGQVNTFEFQKLNVQLSKMTTKAVLDYQRLKEFTENASHELQTPLAIIRAKLEVLLQADQLSSEEQNALLAALEAVRRLANLNQGLILLTKMQNQQMGPDLKCDLGAVIASHAEQVKELVSLQDLELRLDQQTAFWVTLPELVADILIANLIRNAMVHNRPHGTILIAVTDGKITFQNTGSPTALDSDRIFDRFNKGQGDSSNIGLGLAIVKEICVAAALSIDYEFREGSHHFHLTRSGN